MMLLDLLAFLSLTCALFATNTTSAASNDSASSSVILVPGHLNKHENATVNSSTSFTYMFSYDPRRFINTVGESVCLCNSESGRREATPTCDVISAMCVCGVDDSRECEQRCVR